MTDDNRESDSGPFAAARAYSTATLHEAAGQVGALPSPIKPLIRGMRLCGPAFTVESPPMDNLWLHRGIAAAQPGAILVVTVAGAYEAGYWGDVMTTAARARRLGGLVIDGCVRDLEEISASGFPVFARGLCIRGTAKDVTLAGRLGGPVVFPDATVQANDVVVGDDDGVVVLPPDRLDEVVERAQQRLEREADVARQLGEGRTTLEIYGWE